MMRIVERNVSDGELERAASGLFFSAMGPEKAAGGSSLAYRAQATAPADRTKDAQKPEERPAADQAAKGDIRRPNDPKRLTREEAELSSPVAENQQEQTQPPPAAWQILVHGLAKRERSLRLQSRDQGQ